MSIPAPWTQIDQEELCTLRNASIKLINTEYGQFKEQKKTDVERLCTNMSAKEKETLKQRMAEINKAGASAMRNPCHLASPPCR